MPENRTRFMTRSEVDTLLRLGREVHVEGRPWPPEIVAKRKEIDEAERNANLFMVRTGAVDNGMVYRVVDLRLELEGLYAEWVRREAA